MAQPIDTWELLSRISNGFQIFGGIFAFLAWFNLRIQNKRLLQAARADTPKIDGFNEEVIFQGDIHSVNPYAFALSLIPHGGSIKQDVERFLTTKGGKFKGMPIVELNYDGLGPDNIEQFINDLRVKRREFEFHGATEIHLFLAGPVQSGTLVGAIFDNWRPVKLYHNDRNKGYMYWCPLTK